MPCGGSVSDSRRASIAGGGSVSGGPGYPSPPVQSVEPARRINRRPLQHCLAGQTAPLPTARAGSARPVLGPGDEQSLAGPDDEET